MTDDNGTFIELCGYRITGWRATIIFIAFLAMIMYAGFKLGAGL